MEGFLIVIAGIAIFIFGAVAGQESLEDKMIEANKTCWETHAVIIENDEGGVDFKCYEVRKNDI